MADMNAIQQDVSALKRWQGIADHRIATIEKHCKDEVKHRARLEADFNQVDRKVSRIEGGIDFIKWSIPVSMTVLSGLVTLIVYFLTR